MPVLNWTNVSCRTFNIMWVHWIRSEGVCNSGVSLCTFDCDFSVYNDWRYWFRALNTYINVHDCHYHTGFIGEN